MLARCFSLLLVGTIALACGSSDENGDGSSSLPTTFGDCSSPPCEVALQAFTKNPGTIPYCEGNEAAVDLTCPAAQDTQTGSCDGLFVVRWTYAFTGDFYECAYDATSGALVGAKWSPDNHPTQIAGKQVPPTCPLTAVCSSVSDAGAD